MSGVCGLTPPPLLSCSGPPKPTRSLPTQYAIQLSMIVVITSCAPTVALRKPAIAAQQAPASAARTIASRTCHTCGAPGSAAPTQFATIRPIRYWPWPPMLKSPQRKAKATARPTPARATRSCAAGCEVAARAAQHFQPDLLLRGVRPVLRDDPPLVHHEDAVGEREHLVQLERDQQDRAAAVALVHEAAVDVL